VGVKDELPALQWTVATKLTFDQVIAEVDQVLGAKALPDGALKKALVVSGAFKMSQSETAADYLFVKPMGQGKVRVSYTPGDTATVSFTITDPQVKRQQLVLLFIPIPISPWYAPAMAEFRDASARIRARVESR
jgi:hypothetical protein